MYGLYTELLRTVIVFISNSRLSCSLFLGFMTANTFYKSTTSYMVAGSGFVSNIIGG